MCIRDRGHTFAVGAAIAAKFLKARLGHVMDQTIYAYISDEMCIRDSYKSVGNTLLCCTTYSFHIQCISNSVTFTPKIIYSITN